MERKMTQWSKHRGEDLEHLSELVDGEADPAAAARLCAAWQDEAALRETWHAWHLIGDALRSQDLASPAAHDAAFLQAVRARLATEPVVLAPQRRGVAEAPVVTLPARAAERPARRWSGPVAIAAGFMAVAGALLVMQAPLTQSGPALASGSTAADVTHVAALPALAADAATEPQVVNAGDRLIRDARLDRYLAAHKQFGGSSALGVPSGFLRSATNADVPQR
jgi:sigma-E factor negative regulatory protein RseA